jgi:hypothetical protein
MFSKLRTELSQSTGNLDALMDGRQSCAPRLREDVAVLKNVAALESDPSVVGKPFGPQVPKVPRFDLDAANVGDALGLLRPVPAEFTKLVFWDPQFRQLLDEQRYGNEGIDRGKRRKELPPMSPEFISSCDAEIGRFIVQSGYCCRWVDEFQLLNGLFKIDGLDMLASFTGTMVEREWGSASVLLVAPWSSCKNRRSASERRVWRSGGKRCR